MDISYIKVFLTVAEEMNFSRAAKKLFMSQQAVSSTIQKMEAEYGIQLFERKPVLRLTVAGAELKAYGANVVASYNSMCQALSGANRSYSSKIRMGMSALRNDVFFTEIWEDFHEKRPNVCLETTAFRSWALQKMLHGGELSVCLALNLKPDEHMVVKELARERICCGISLKFLQRYHPEITVSDMKRMEKEGITRELLTGLPCFAQSEEGVAGSKLNENVRVLYQNIIGIADQADVLYELAKTGEGYSWLFPVIHYLYREEVNREDGDLWILPFAFETGEFRFCAAYSKEHMLSQAEMELIDTIEKIGEKYADFLIEQGYMD